VLFNSYSFIFLFLPTTFAGMFWLGKYSQRLAALWLGLLSLIFYAVWDSRFVVVLLSSIAFNYGAGYLIGLRHAVGARMQAKHLLVAAIVANLMLLGYFKYTNFFITAMNTGGLQLKELDIVLPLGISFFTFTQIAFLVDVYRGIAREANFIHYLLFVTYFPHLIAGPVLHHKQMMPQFANPATYRINSGNIAVGLTIFVLGLSKKVLIADSLAEYANPVFDLARDGHAVMFFEAWIGALAYTLQLYFDFSGYTDMAIGLSLMLNVRLPLNFDSPYQATSIIDFWRRWHITLSAFLRDYLYFPLGGNRKGPLRRYVNLLATMLLGGLWHGAGWTFIFWGGLHGIYLMINHGWRELKVRRGWGEGGSFTRLAAGAITFVAILVAWVFFRAETFSGAWSILSGMVGINGISLPPSLEGGLAPVTAVLPRAFVVFEGMLPNISVFSGEVFGGIFFGLALVWLFPNVEQVMRKYKPTWEDLVGKPAPAPMSQGPIARALTWTPTAIFATILGALFFACTVSLTRVSEFLYFQF